MKYIQLRVEDNIHKNIKVRAISIGVSIQEYILERVFNHRYDEVPKPTKEPKLSIKEIAKKPKAVSVKKCPHANEYVSICNSCK